MTSPGLTSAIMASQHAWVELLPMRIFLHSSPAVITIVVPPWSAASLNCISNSCLKWSTDTN